MAPKEEMHPFPDTTFVLAVKVTTIVIGIIFLVGGWFILNIWIPTDTTGIWRSMPGWLKISAVQTITIAMFAGGLIVVISTSFLLISVRRWFMNVGGVKPYLDPPSSLRAWALGQAVVATLMVYMPLRSWYDFNVLRHGGAEWFVPLIVPFSVLAVEVPALVLALLTWINPRPVHWPGWFAIGALRLLACVPFFFTPWIIPLPSNPNFGSSLIMIMGLPAFFHQAEFILALTTMVFVMPLRSTFMEEGIY